MIGLKRQGLRVSVCVCVCVWTLTTLTCRRRRRSLFVCLFVFDYAIWRKRAQRI